MVFWVFGGFCNQKLSFLNKTKDFVSPDYLFYKEREREKAKITQYVRLETDTSETQYTMKVAWPVGFT